MNCKLGWYISAGIVFVLLHDIAIIFLFMAHGWNRYELSEMYQYFPTPLYDVYTMELGVLLEFDMKYDQVKLIHQYVHGLWRAGLPKCLNLEISGYTEGFKQCPTCTRWYGHSHFVEGYRHAHDFGVKYNAGKVYTECFCCRRDVFRDYAGYMKKYMKCMSDRHFQRRVVNSMGIEWAYDRLPLECTVEMAPKLYGGILMVAANTVQAKADYIMAMYSFCMCFDVPYTFIDRRRLSILVKEACGGARGATPDLWLRTHLIRKHLTNGDIVLVRIHGNWMKKQWAWAGVTFTKAWPGPWTIIGDDGRLNVGFENPSEVVHHYS